MIRTPRIAATAAVGAAVAAAVLATAGALLVHNRGHHGEAAVSEPGAGSPLTAGPAAATPIRHLVVVIGREAGSARSDIPSAIVTRLDRQRVTWRRFGVGHAPLQASARQGRLPDVSLWRPHDDIRSVIGALNAVQRSTLWPRTMVVALHARTWDWYDRSHGRGLELSPWLAGGTTLRRDVTPAAVAAFITRNWSKRPSRSIRSPARGLLSACDFGARHGRRVLLTPDGAVRSIGVIRLRP